MNKTNWRRVTAYIVTPDGEVAARVLEDEHPPTSPAAAAIDAAISYHMLTGAAIGHCGDVVSGLELFLIAHGSNPGQLADRGVEGVIFSATVGGEPTVVGAGEIDWSGWTPANLLPAMGDAPWGSGVDTDYGRHDLPVVLTSSRGEIFPQAAEVFDRCREALVGCRYNIGICRAYSGVAQYREVVQALDDRRASDGDETSMTRFPRGQRFSGYPVVADFISPDRRTCVALVSGEVRSLYDIEYLVVVARYQPWVDSDDTPQRLSDLGIGDSPLWADKP